MAVPTVAVRIDWDADGAFTGGYDDVSSRVLSDSVSWTRGRSADFSAEATGAASFTFRDDDHRFTPDRNWHDNPSFERGTTGWSTAPALPNSPSSAATSITQVTDDAGQGGTKAGEVVCSGSQWSGVVFAIPYAFRQSVTYSVAIWLKKMSGSTSIDCGLYSTTAGIDVAVGAGTITTSWAKYTFTWTPTSDHSDVVLWARCTAAAAATFRIDAIQVNPGATANPYLEAPTKGQLVPGRPVHIYATYSATDYPLFSGYIERLTPDPRAQTTTVVCYDVLRRMAETDAIIPSATLMTRSARDFRIAALDEYERGSRNHLTNPSFETDVTQWTVANGTLVRNTGDAAPVGGAACATLTWSTATASASSVVRLVPLVFEGQLYRFSVYLKASSPQAAVIGMGEDVGITTYRSKTVAVTSTWQRFTLTYPAPTTRFANSAQMLRAYVTIASGAILVDAAMLTRGQALVPYVDAGTGRWPNWVANGSFDGGALSGWYDAWANLCANPSFEADTTGWGGVSRVSTAPNYGTWHGSAANMSSISYTFSGTFKAGKTYDLRIAMRTVSSTGVFISVSLGSSGTPADAAASSLLSIGTSYAIYAVAWTPSADRTDAVFGTTNYSGAGYVDGLQVARRDNAMSNGPGGYSNTGVGGGGSFVSSVAVDAPAKYGSLAHSFATPATAGAGRVYDFYHDGAVFVSGVQYAASVWAYSSSSMPYKFGIGANKDDGTFDEATTTGTLSATTWTKISVTWTPSADRFGSTLMLHYMLFFQQTDATARTVRLDGVRVAPGATTEDVELAQWDLDATEADAYAVAAEINSTVRAALTTVNGLTLTRDWIEPEVTTPWYTYRTSARASMATKASAETYNDDLADMSSAEIDRASIINIVAVSYSNGTEHYSDAASVGRYGPRPGATISGGGWFSGPTIPDSVGPALVARYKDPRARPTITVVNRFPSQLARELNDLVTVNFARLGITGGKYLIASMTTTISLNGNWWATTYQLEEHPY